MNYKNLPAWLKGGVIANVVFLFVLFLLELYVRFLREWIQIFFGMQFYGGGGVADFVLGWTALSIQFLYGLPFIVVFIVGAIVGTISGTTFRYENTVKTKGSKIGFSIGIIASILLFVISIIDKYYSLTFGLTQPFQNSLFQSPLLELLRIPWFVYLLPFILPIVLGWIGWVIGGVLKRTNSSF